MTNREKIVLACVFWRSFVLMAAQSFIPALKTIDRSALILVSTLLVLHSSACLTVNDLEEILEHHPAVLRRIVDRFLPVEDRRGAVDGSGVAGPAQGRPLVGVRHGHRRVRPW